MSTNKSSKISTKTRLKIGFGIIIASILFFVVFAIIGNIQIDKSHDKIFTTKNIIIITTNLHADINELRSLMHEYIIDRNDVAKNDSTKHNISRLNSLLPYQIKTIDSLLSIYPEQKILFGSFTKILNQYFVNALLFTDFIDDSKFIEANKLIEEEQTRIENEVYEKLEKIENDLSAISEKIEEDNHTFINVLNISLLVLGISVLIISVLIAISMFRMLKNISFEIKNGVNILGTSASEILTTVTEISTGAAETATSVSETTITVEEVRQTAMVSNQKAQSLMESSQRAANSVDKGREAINEVIESMKRIDNQMNIISETIIKLSEQNRTISEITSSVADISDQSNLLAVNAAIEAAKAGEHGRGFTVVAQEIRSLADQSKKATIQIKEILNEINKSVNHAVAVTELGTKTVDEGRNLVAQSGEVIELLAENVEETAQASIQISSSNQQQMAGMEQIVPAMENIKQASEQNVIGMKQAQAAAHDLNNLGQNLKEVIEKFNL